METRSWNWQRTFALALALVGSGAVAGTTSTSFTVQGTVTANCSISVPTGISFIYDPVVANAIANATNSGTLSVACTKGSAPVISLDAGLHAANAPPGSTRAMAVTITGTTYYLGYDIRQPGTLVSWGTAGGSFTPSAPTSKASRNFSLDGVAGGGQDVPPGTYTDTVTATVNF
jgi:spore coat protein U-like protein